eukprot:TRINITY_DN4612_c0_g1_i1.p1 TRINITY_DN4612_c0_g1~~TRINITY_DN4612_c0_g1_i1.p1  ORF type:complete len:394 (+),score=100.91 TRINITY_DN4612_c0_g1_i1:90-1271(+)
MLLWRINENNWREIDGMDFNFMNDCAYSPNGEFLIIVSYQEVYIIDMKTEKLKHTLKVHTNQVNAVSFSQDGQFFATCSLERIIIIFRLEDFSIVRKFKNDTYTYGICFSNCGNFLYSSDYNGYLKKWNVIDGIILLKTIIHSSGICMLKFCSNRNYILTGSDDSTAKLVDHDDLSVVHTFNQCACVRAIDFHPTKLIIAVGDEKCKVKLWNMGNGLYIHSFNLGGYVSSLHFLNRSILVVSSADGYVISFDVDSFQQIQKIHCGLNNHSSFAISSKLYQLACGKCFNNNIRIYSIIHSYDTSNHVELIELSRENVSVLSNLIDAGVETDIIRQLVRSGIWINREEYQMIFDICWDLIDINENNGGNMNEFIDNRTNFCADNDSDGFEDEDEN